MYHAGATGGSSEARQIYVGDVGVADGDGLDGPGLVSALACDLESDRGSGGSGGVRCVVGRAAIRRVRDSVVYVQQ